MPSSDEGGGMACHDGGRETVGTIYRYTPFCVRTSLPQSASLTAPSSEGAIIT